MKVISLAVAGVSLVLIALTLVPAAGDYRPFLAIGALVCAAAVLITILAGWREQPTPTVLTPAAERPSVPAQEAEERSAPASSAQWQVAGTIAGEKAGSSAEPFAAHYTANSAAAKAVPAAAAPDSDKAQVVGFLATLQEKGRLVDFLEDDIASYTDAQVGAAARVVHQGCKAVLHDYFRIAPVRAENEGTKVTVAAGYAADEYRLVGKISGQAPFSGTLMHRGWKAESVNLPRVLRTGDDRLPTIAPAEVELR